MRFRSAVSRQAGLLGLLLVGILGGGGVARAGHKERVVILVFTIAGDAQPELRNQMEKSLIGGLSVAGYEVVPKDEMAQRLKSAHELEGCFSTTCLERLGDLLGAKRFVNARVEASGASYTIELQLLGSDASGGLVQRLEKPCPVCTLAEANDVMSKAASELTGVVAPVEAKLAMVTVRTRPEGALVVIDDGKPAPAPVSAKVKPGEHRFRATMPKGYVAADVKRSVSGDQDVELVLEATPIDTEVPPPATASRFGAWKWVTTVGAVGALGAGVYLISINNKGTNCDATGACADKYSTLVPGAVVAGAGVALGGLAIYMFTHDHPRSELAPEAAILPTVGGATLVFGGRF